MEDEGEEEAKLEAWQELSAEVHKTDIPFRERVKIITTCRIRAERQGLVSDRNLNHRSQNV